MVPAQHMATGDLLAAAAPHAQLLPVQQDTSDGGEKVIGRVVLVVNLE